MADKQQLAVRLERSDLRRIDAVIERGRFPSRAAAIRAGLGLLLRAEREREIAEEYRRAYSGKPQEQWIGDAGLAAGAELVRRDAGGSS
jgi:Arc/MetJ-type ribon-helix-helix transcriptional regulator